MGRTYRPHEGIATDRECSRHAGNGHEMLHEILHDISTSSYPRDGLSSRSASVAFAAGQVESIALVYDDAGGRVLLDAGTVTARSFE